MAAESLSLNIIYDNALVAAELAEARVRLGDILSRGTPENTRRAYESDWRYVTSWHELRLITKAKLPLSADPWLGIRSQPWSLFRRNVAGPQADEVPGRHYLFEEFHSLPHLG